MSERPTHSPGSRKRWLGLLVLAAVIVIAAWLAVTFFRKKPAPAPSESPSGASAPGTSPAGAGPIAGASFVNVLLGCTPVNGVTESGFQFQEKTGSEPFRWTDGAAKLTVPIDAKRPPQRLWVSVEIFRPKPTRIRCQILVDSVAVFDGPVWTGKWAINLDLSSHRFSDRATIELRSDKFVPQGVMDGGKNTDPRTLGVQVKGVMLLRDDGRPDAKKRPTVRGRALDQQGRPAADIVIAAMPAYGPADFGQDGRLAERAGCVSLTNNRGEFCLGPLAEGAYDIRPRGLPDDTLIEGRKPVAPLDVFPQEAVSLKTGSAQSVEIRGAPGVTLEVQYVDSTGKPVAGYPLGVWGQYGSASFDTYERPNSSGRVVFRVPKGLERTSLGMPIEGHMVFRHRTSKNAPLSNRVVVELGKLTADLPEAVEIVCYRAPVLVVKASKENGEPVPDFRPRVDYPEDKNPRPGSRDSYGTRGAVGFEKQDDGRWRSMAWFLLPDEPFTLTIEAPGHKPKTGKLSLREGEVKEVDVKLEPQESK